MKLKEEVSIKTISFADVIFPTAPNERDRDRECYAGKEQGRACENVSQNKVGRA